MSLIDEQVNRHTSLVEKRRQDPLYSNMHQDGKRSERKATPEMNQPANALARPSRPIRTDNFVFERSNTGQQQAGIKYSSLRIRIVPEITETNASPLPEDLSRPTTYQNLYLNRCNQ